MELERLFSNDREVLEAYLLVVIGVLTVIAFMMAAGAQIPDQSQTVINVTMLILLIGVNVLNAMILLRLLEYVRGDGDL